MSTKSGFYPLMLKNVFIMTFIAATFGPLVAQTTGEILLEAQTESSEQSELAELFDFRAKHPINLNAASKRQLAEMPGIGDHLAEAILLYRKKIGHFELVEQMLDVPGMTDDIFYGIVDFISAGQFTSTTPFLPELSIRTRISDQITLKSTPQKIYNRVRFKLQAEIEGGILLEKDAGEKKIDDLRLFYLQSSFGKYWRAIVGNYQLQFGQGLVFWGPYGFARSSAATFPVRKNGTGFRRYQSVDENAGLFGTAVSFQARRLNFSVFASHNKMDATLFSDSSVTTISTTGLHRSESERNRKNTLAESLLGARVELAVTPDFRIGLTGFWSQFDKKVLNQDLERNRFDFRGSKNYVLGMDWIYSAKTAELFGEIARSESQGIAFLSGLRLKVNTLSLAFLHRNYHRDFQNIHSFGLGERNGETQNEIGYYTGIEYKLSARTNFSAYYDIFSFPWRSFFEPLPRGGNDFLSQIEHKFNQNLVLALRFRQKLTENYTMLPSITAQPREELVEEKRAQVRVQLDMRVSRTVSLRSRFEHVKLTNTGFPDTPSSNNEAGFLVYQDLRLLLFKKLHITTRLSLFETDSFASSVYQYEHDLPGVLSNRALFGRGSRWYVLLKYHPNSPVAVHLKYSETFRDDSNADNETEKRIGVQVDMAL